MKINLTLLHSESPKLHTIFASLSEVGLRLFSLILHKNLCCDCFYMRFHGDIHFHGDISKIILQSSSDPHLSLYDVVSVLCTYWDQIAPDLSWGPSWPVFQYTLIHLTILYCVTAHISSACHMFMS